MASGSFWAPHTRSFRQPLLCPASSPAASRFSLTCRIPASGSSLSGQSLIGIDCRFSHIWITANLRHVGAAATAEADDRIYIFANNYQHADAFDGGLLVDHRGLAIG